MLVGLAVVVARAGSSVEVTGAESDVAVDATDAVEAWLERNGLVFQNGFFGVILSVVFGSRGPPGTIIGPSSASGAASLS